MPKKVHCSFCGKIEDEVQHLIEGPNGVYICEECIATEAIFPMIQANLLVLVCLSKTARSCRMVQRMETKSVWIRMESFFRLK